MVQDMVMLTRTTALILAMTASIIATPAAFGYPMIGVDPITQNGGISYADTDTKTNSAILTQILFDTGYAGINEGHFESVKMLYDTAQSVIRKM